MKKMLVLFLTLTLTAGLCFAAMAETADTLTWRGYTLQATWLTTDRADINIHDLREDGQFAMVRLVPVEGTVNYETVNDYAGEELYVKLASGDKMPLGTVLYHTFLPNDGTSVFPEIDPEQKNFDALFFLEGGTEADLEGAALAIVDDGAEQTLALDAIPREKPES